MISLRISALRSDEEMGADFAGSPARGFLGWAVGAPGAGALTFSGRGFAQGPHVQRHQAFVAARPLESAASFRGG
jgi:hypothetical protein